MKSIYALFASLLLLSSVTVGGQELSAPIQVDGQVEEIPKNIFKADRYIYLWDVTHSMQGLDWDQDSIKYKYNKDTDIYDQVVEELVRDISIIPDESTEIVVIPFQNASPKSYQGTKHPWIYKTASGQNKQELISKIRSNKKEWLEYKYGTGTDVVPALSYVIHSVISSDRVNYLKILTDGKMKDEQGLRRLMAEWCQLANQNHSMYAFYISLNNEASIAMKKLIQEFQGCFKFVDKTDLANGALDFYQVLPYPTIAVNCNDQFAAQRPSVTVQLQEKSSRELPNSFKVHFEEENNPFLTVNNHLAAVKGNTFSLPLQFKMDLNSLKQHFQNGMKYPVRVKMKKEDGDNIYLLEDTITLYLSVDKEKKMTLNWE